MTNQSKDRSRFERDYEGWLRGVAGDVAHRLTKLPLAQRDSILQAYQRLSNPSFVYSAYPDTDALEELIGDKIARCIVAKTEAVSFFPSIYSTMPWVLDFSVVMSRRLYYNGLWFSAISIVDRYAKNGSNRMMTFALEHEFELLKIYEDMSSEKASLIKALEMAKPNSVIKKLGIKPDELREDERLILSLTETQPLIPKPYAEMALLVYLQDNFDRVEDLGYISQNEDEDVFGRGLYEEFGSWEEFTKSSYQLFVSEIQIRLKDAYTGYI